MDTMKARDIIPGWPRSRSTMSAASFQRWPRFQLAGREAYWRVEMAMQNRDNIQNRTYHDVQQFRQNAWFESWRNPEAEEILIPDAAARRLLDVPHAWALRVNFRKSDTSKPSSLLYVPK